MFVESLIFFMKMIGRGYFESITFQRPKDNSILNPNQTVQNDSEIQNWINEVRKDGFANALNAIQKSINSVKELEILLTSIIFNCSVQHTGQLQSLTSI